MLVSWREASNLEIRCGQTDLDYHKQADVERTWKTPYDHRLQRRPCIIRIGTTFQKELNHDSTHSSFPLLP